MAGPRRHPLEAGGLRPDGCSTRRSRVSTHGRDPVYGAERGATAVTEFEFGDLLRRQMDVVASPRELAPAVAAYCGHPCD